MSTRCWVAGLTTAHQGRRQRRPAAATAEAGIPRLRATTSYRPAKLMKWTVALAAVAALQGCVPLLLGGAVIGGGLVATDRRSTGIQIEDEAIEKRALARIRELATLGQVNVNSYNRLVLITGEVPASREKQAIEAAVLKVENVRSVVNDLTIARNSGLGARSGDTVLNSKVKASLIDAPDLQANAYKVVVERGVVYLMGRVTQREAERGVEVARAVPGVEKVVKVFEILTEEEVARMGRAGAGAAAAAATAPTAPVSPAPATATTPATTPAGAASSPR
jgi:osmotically-inducible protein OsmY